DLGHGLAALEAELQLEQGLPDLLQLTHDDDHDAFEDLLLDLGDVAAIAHGAAVAAEHEVNHGIGELEVHLQGGADADGEDADGGHVADLGQALGELAEAQLLDGDDADLELGAQVGAEHVAEVAGEAFMQAADGAALLAGDL